MKNRIFIGLGFILSAVWLILNQLNIVQALSIWRIVATFVWGAFVYNAIFDRSLGKFFVGATGLVVLYKDYLGLEKVATFHLIVAGVLLYIGISYIVPFNNKSNKATIETTYTKEWNTTLFGETNRYIHQQDLEKLSISCLFGSATYDFGASDIRDDEATLNVSVHFGEMTIYVPNNWEVINKVGVVFGETNLKGRQDNAVIKNKQLIITGSVAFGEITIIYI